MTTMTDSRAVVIVADAISNEAYEKAQPALHHIAARLLEPVEAQGGGEVVAWRILWSPQFPETAELTSDGERVQKVRALDNSPQIEPLYTAPPSAPVGVEKVKKALERPGRTIEACAKLTQLLGDGQPHSDLISTAGGQAALAKEAIQRALAQQTAAVDGDFINRIADSLIAKGWDIDPNCDGTGVAQLREAVISAIAQQPADVVVDDTRGRSK